MQVSYQLLIISHLWGKDMSGRTMYVPKEDIKIGINSDMSAL